MAIKTTHTDYNLSFKKINLNKKLSVGTWTIKTVESF
jgi:hypothetical protein